MGLLFFACAIASFLLVQQSNTLLADEAPDWVRAYAQESHEKRQLFLKRVNSKEKQRKTTHPLENPLEPFYGSIHINGLGPGEIGRIKGDQDCICDVVQIFDEANMLVEFGTWSGGRRIVTSIGDDGPTTQYIPRAKRDTKLFWVTNYDTSDLVDGDRIGDIWDKIFRGTKNATYKTVLGTNTVLKIEYVDIEPYRDLFTRIGDARTWTITDKDGTRVIKAIYSNYERRKAHLYDLEGKLHHARLDQLSDEDQAYVADARGLTKPKPIAQEKKSVAATNAFRTWTSANGKFSLAAELVGTSADKITLRRKDGKTVTVLIAKLSKADQKFLASR